MALLASAGAAGAAEPSQKPLIEAFVTHSGLPRGWVVAIKPEIVVAIRDRDTLKVGESLQKVRLQGEATDEDTADRLGYRSMRSVVEINCDTRRDRVVEMEAFPQHDLKGAGQKRAVPGGWAQPSEDAFLADVIRAVCRAPRPAPSEIAAASPPLRPSTSPDHAPPRSTPAPIARPPQPAVAEAVAPARSQPPPPRLMSVVATLPSGRSGAPAGAGFRAQLGALDSEADARRVLDGLTLSPGLSAQVEPATVGARTYYRAMVMGFGGKAQAQAFCAARRRQAAACLIR